MRGPYLSSRRRHRVSCDDIHAVTLSSDALYPQNLRVPETTR